MEEKLLQEVIERIIGKPGSVIVALLKDKKDVNEFKIADKLKLTINQVRNLLYKLYEQNIVSFTRKKDKTKGWYIYYWTLNHLKALELLLKMKQKEIQQGQSMVKSRENKRFYRCPDGDVEMTEENALHHDFICPECGKLLEIHNEKEKLSETAKNIETGKGELEVIQKYVTIIKDAEAIKAEKIREVASVKKKRTARRLRKKARKHKLALVNKLAGNKIPAKKAVKVKKAAKKTAPKKQKKKKRR